MIIKSASIPDIKIIEPKVYGDERGFFMETYQKQIFHNAGISAQFVQDNHSGSRQGTLRGLHYQIKNAQGKLMRVIAGEIFDAAVDMRAASPTFGQWFGISLSATNRTQLWIPAGFAHGFYVLSEWAEIVYKATDYYKPEWERSLAWNDPDIAIQWPLLKVPGRPGQAPILSPRDQAGVSFREAEKYP